MPKPGTVSNTIKGTRFDDVFVFLDGELSLNGSLKSYDPSAPLTLNGEAGDDRFVTDSPHGAFYDGGRGSDTLDFSHLTENVAVMTWGSSPGITTGFTLVYYSEYGFSSEHNPEAFPSGGTHTENISSIENVIGGSGNDFISISGVPGTVDGGPGNDHLEGGLANDTLLGGLGDDLLWGKGGDDSYTGGDGADEFHFTTRNGHDTVLDFDPSEGDHLYIGQQQDDPVPTSDSWYEISYTMPDGTVVTALRADYSGGSLTLVGYTLADVTTVMNSMTVFDWG